MNRPYGLTIQEIADCVVDSQMASAINAEHSAQKKLLEYLAGRCPHNPHIIISVWQCVECREQLLKDFGIGE